MRFFLTILIALFFKVNCFSQGLMDLKDLPTRQDTLRGSITKERSWWDLSYYHLDITIDPENKSIEGSNEIYYKVLSNYSVLQIDLQEPLFISKIIQNNQKLLFKRDGNVYYICLLYTSPSPRDRQKTRMPSSA